MIGNDIVDLVLARKESNWKRSGFLDKIFTEKEQTLILNSKNPEITVWNLWSRKEATYKIINRETQKRVFIPLQLECFDIETNNNKILGKTLYQEKFYFTQTIINEDFIYSECVLRIADFKNITNTHSKHISKDKYGIPYNLMSGTPVSVTHHGRFERKVELESNA